MMFAARLLTLACSVFIISFILIYGIGSFLKNTTVSDSFEEEMRTLISAQKDLNQVMKSIDEKKQLMWRDRSTQIELQKQITQSEKIARMKKDEVDALLQDQREREKAAFWSNITLALLTGVISSFIATALWIFCRQRACKIRIMFGSLSSGSRHHQT